MCRLSLWFLPWNIQPQVVSDTLPSSVCGTVADTQHESSSTVDPPRGTDLFLEGSAQSWLKYPVCWYWTPLRIEDIWFDRRISHRCDHFGHGCPSESPDILQQSIRTRSRISSHKLYGSWIRDPEANRMYSASRYYLHQRHKECFSERAEEMLTSRRPSPVSQQLMQVDQEDKLLCIISTILHL